MKIVGRCDGLPLAVKVIGGMLRRKARTRGAWMDIFSNIAWSFSETSDDLNKAVYVSYEELAPHLKQCLMYCSLWPKDRILVGSFIVRMWMAEGFVHNSRGSKLTEDLGLEYYRELISRNLLESYDELSDELVCTMHDVVRSFAQFVAKDEGLLINGGQDVSSSLSNLKLRHLSISGEAIDFSALEAQVSLRTLLLFNCPVVTLKDFLNDLCCLRVLYISDVNLVELPESVCQLKHLRYLGLRGTGIAAIPQGIGDLMFLQVIDLGGSFNLCHLPESILKLHRLTFINLHGTRITSIPCGFGKLENLVMVLGFPTHYKDTEDSWCSLEELGSLSKLTHLDIEGLEKAPSGSVAARAKLSGKQRMILLKLTFTSRLADSGEPEDHISEEQQAQVEDVLSNLCPPPSIETLVIIGYFGRVVPQWMRTMSVFESLRRLQVMYACCEQLFNGLGQLPFLDFLWVDRAPSIKCIGHDFLLPTLGGGDGGHLSQAADVAFPRLRNLGLLGMFAWRREWEWEERFPAMPALENLTITNCQLDHLPPGFAYHARALRLLELINVPHLVCVENFTSLVNIRLVDNPKLERVANNQSLQHIEIHRCPGVKVLENLPSLRRMEWKDLDAEELPDYLRDAKLNKLRVDCSLTLLKVISLQDEASEWGKIQHVQQLNAIGWTSDEDQVDRHIYYTKEPYSFDADMGEESDSRDGCENDEVEEK